MNFTKKNKNQSETLITWSEVRSDGTIQEKSYMCKSQDAMWHLIQLRKSPSVILNPKIGK